MTERSAPVGDRWAARPRAAFALRVLGVVLPPLSAAVLALGFSYLLPPPGDLTMSIVWVVGLVLAAGVGLALGNRWRGRLLVAVALLRLELAFPGSAPSRLRIMATVLRNRTLGRRLDRAAGGGRTGSVAPILDLVLSHAGRGPVDDRHPQRILAYADLLAGELGLDAEEQERLRWALVLLPAAALTVPGGSWDRPAELTGEEAAALRRHRGAGRMLLGPLASWLGQWVDAVTQHQAHWDGHGAPRGLAGEDIVHGARMLAVIDAFERVTAGLDGSEPGDLGAALAELRRQAGSAYDPAVVDAFLSIPVVELRRVRGARTRRSQAWARAWGKPARRAAVQAAVVVALVAVGTVVLPRATSGDAAPSQVEPTEPAEPTETPTPAPTADVEPTVEPVPPVPEPVQTDEPDVVVEPTPQQTVEIEVLGRGRAEPDNGVIIVPLDD